MLSCQVIHDCLFNFTHNLYISSQKLLMYNNKFFIYFKIGNVFIFSVTILIDTVVYYIQNCFFMSDNNGINDNMLFRCEKYVNVTVIHHTSTFVDVWLVLFHVIFRLFGNFNCTCCVMFHNTILYLVKNTQCMIFV